MKSVLTILILSCMSLSHAQIQNRDPVSIDQLRLKSAEVKQKEILERIMAVTHTYESDPQMKQVLEEMAGTFVSVGAISVIVGYFAQTIRGTINNTMGTEETHLQRVGIKSLKFGGLLSLVATGVHFLYLTHSQAYLDEKKRLEVQNREQTLEEYRKLLLALNEVTATITSLKAQN
jgi:hypothetical protein